MPPHRFDRCCLICAASTTAAEAVDLQQILLLAAPRPTIVDTDFPESDHAGNQYRIDYRKVVAGVGLKAGCEYIRNMPVE